MDFSPCKVEHDIWMRQYNGLWEYISVYVDDLLFVVYDPKASITLLKEKYKYKFKGTGNITYHLGCAFFRDDEDIVCMAPKKHIEKMNNGYTSIFIKKPSSKYKSPLEKGDYPELETAEILNEDAIKIYQSLIGALQWALPIGKIDIDTAIMSLSSHRSAPTIGHLERAKRVMGYLSKMKEKNYDLMYLYLTIQIYHINNMTGKNQCMGILKKH